MRNKYTDKRSTPDRRSTRSNFNKKKGVTWEDQQSENSKYSQKKHKSKATPSGLKKNYNPKDELSKNFEDYQEQNLKQNSRAFIVEF